MDASDGQVGPRSLYCYRKSRLTKRELNTLKGMITRYITETEAKFPTRSTGWNSRGALHPDGHSRLEAYRRHELTAKRLVGIPVRWFSSSTKEALLEAASSNVKVRLQTAPEQLQLAWRLDPLR